jgi:hypothetical protein
VTHHVGSSPPRAEAKKVLSGLSDNLKIDNHLTYVHAVQFCKFPLHTLGKPQATLRRRLGSSCACTATTTSSASGIVRANPPCQSRAPGQLSDPWKCERPTGSPAFFTCSRAPGTTRREAALCYAARNGGRTRCRSRCGENDAHSSPSFLIDTAGSREPASSAVGRRRASKFSH